MPETVESIDLSQPVCSVCKQNEEKHAVNEAEWANRRSVLERIAESARGSAEYDCIVPFSGGKDSTFTLYFATKHLRLRPLVVRFDHGFLRQRVLDNSRRTFRRLGVDVLHFTPNWHVVKKLMLESLKRRGDFCWHCHTGVFAFPVQEAVRRKIPLIVWGEGDNEYASWGTEEHNRERFDKVCNLGINSQDMAGFVGLTDRDLGPFAYPDSLAARDIRSIFLGDYIKWNPKAQAALIKKELGWQGDEVEGVPPQYDYDKIECFMQGARDYIKFLKRGYGRTAHLTSIDVREGRISRAEALRLAVEHDGKRPASLDLLLDILEIPEKEFMEIVEQHVVEPHVMPTRIERANWALHDAGDWHV